MDGQRILSCLALAVQFQGREITTIEGLASGHNLHPLQQGFIDHDGFQCGYCTPASSVRQLGWRMSSGAASGQAHQTRQTKTIALTHDELRERMSGNLCRCGAYNGIVDAITQFTRRGRYDPFYLYAPATPPKRFGWEAGGCKYLGGGANLVDLMRETLERPATLVDVTGLSTTIEQREDDELLIGAGVRNTALAEHQAVRMRYPVLTRAILAGASPQIRNMATVGGNLLQRTRCTYSMTMTERAVTSANR